MSVVCLCFASLFSCNQQQPAQTQTDMKYKNEVIENIMTRRSIRNYKDGAVARETMDEILNCGINAPSGMNRQSWEVRVIDNPETIAKFKSLLVASNPETKAEAVEGCFRGAPTLVFVANDPSYEFSPIDCGLLSENIMLSAWSLEVGSVCLGSPIRYLANLRRQPRCLASARVIFQSSALDWVTLTSHLMQNRGTRLKSNIWIKDENYKR